MQGPISARISHFRESFRRPPWLLVLPGIFAFVAVADWLRGSPDWTPWLVLVALSLVAVLFEGSYRRYRSLESRVEAVSRERPFVFVDCDFAVDVAAIRQRQLLRIVGWSLKFKNQSRRLLRFEVENAWLKAGDKAGIAQPPAVIDPNASPLMEVAHRMPLSEPLDVGPVPATFVVGFTVHYDNVPPIGRRTSIREIRFDVSALLPVTYTSTIVRREEL